MPSITTPIPSENCRSVKSVDFARRDETLYCSQTMQSTLLTVL